jgi:uncharacterized protein YbaA (DUF1428 family)
MSYIEGFLTPVKIADKDKYIAHAAEAAKMFKQWGALRVVETWADDVPEGKVTDFYRAVNRKEGETVVFSFIEYPDRATRDAVNVKMMNDPAMAQMNDMPFDGQRMIYGGFAVVLDE